MLAESTPENHSRVCRSNGGGDEIIVFHPSRSGRGAIQIHANAAKSRRNLPFVSTRVRCKVVTRRSTVQCSCNREVSFTDHIIKDFLLAGNNILIFLLAMLYLRTMIFRGKSMRLKILCQRPSMMS